LATYNRDEKIRCLLRGSKPDEQEVKTLPAKAPS